MINTAELGRKMMAYANKIDNDTEFNLWCRLAPKLVGLGTATYPRSINELSVAEREIIKRAIAILVSNGEIVLKGHYE